MIASFGCKETEKIWKGIRSAKLPNEMQQVARRKLRMLHNAVELNDLRVPPANRLEKLTGDLLGYYSIRVNRQWRIIFQWEENDAHHVEIVDYH